MYVYVYIEILALYTSVVFMHEIYQAAVVNHLLAVGGMTEILYHGVSNFIYFIW